MSKIHDLWASFQIFSSNFTASYGSLFNWVLAVVVLAVLIFILARAGLAGRKGLRGASPMAGEPPHPVLTQRAAESLSTAIRYPTVTGNQSALRDFQRYLCRRYPRVMAVMDCACLPDGSMLLRWKAPQSQLDPVMLCAHLDVVPGGEGWTVCKPFDGLRLEGRIYGRGAVDCKGVVIAMLEAAESLIAEGHNPKRELFFAFGADEETGGHVGAQQMARILERQGMKFDLVLDEGGTIQDTQREGRRYAAAVVCMGEKRQCNYRITAVCPSGHTSQPLRTTALGVLSEALCRVESAQPRIRVIPLVRKYLDGAVASFPFGKRLALTNRFIFRLVRRRIFRKDPELMALLRTTVVPVCMDGSFEAANMLPASTTATLNARLLPGDTPQKILEELQGLLADLPLEVELVSEGEESFITSEKQPLYRQLREVLQERYPQLPCIPSLMSSSGDARHYSNMSDCVLRFSPLVTGEEAGCGGHAADEFLSEQSLGVAVEFYRHLMRKL